MSGANYEYCPGCDSKALYTGEEDVPDGVVIWHQACLESRDSARTQALADAVFTLNAVRDWAERARETRAYETTTGDYMGAADDVLRILDGQQ